ncbi:MAG: BlaI/MecI/CopY family transcriptional regulator [Jiangellaceae bacterium]
MLVGALSPSGKWRAVLAESEDQLHLIEALDGVVHRLGGCTKRWRFDRMATVCHPPSGRISATFAPVAKHYDIRPSRHGNRKGRLSPAGVIGHRCVRRPGPNWLRCRAPRRRTLSANTSAREAVVPRFGDLEAEIMGQVWRSDGPVLVRDVVEGIRRERQVAFTTVQTVMEILYRKGWLARAKEGRAYRYRASRSREEYTAQLLSEAFDTTPDRGAAFSRLLEEMEPGEIAELSRALEEARNRGAGR